MARRWARLTAIAGVWLGTSVGASPAPPPVQAPAMFAAQPPRAQAQSDQGVARSRDVIVDFEALPTRGVPGQPPDRGGRLSLDLFSGVSLVAVFDRFDPNTNGITWVGHVDGVPMSTVTFVYGGGVVVGSIVTPTGTYSVRPSPAGVAGAASPSGSRVHVITEADQGRLLPEAPPIPVDAPAVPQALGDPIPQSDPATTIDVLVVYTANAMAAAGGATGMVNLINLGVSETNTSYANSGITHRIRLVHTQQVSYSETNALATSLTDVRNGTGGLSGVAALRDAYGADLVSFIVYPPVPDSCGIAYVMSTVSAGFASFGYSVVDGACVSSSLAHELGHNMGAQHDWFVSSATTPYTYAHGYVNSVQRWRTVMAYNDNCSVQGFNCTRLLYWSNPAVLFSGAPMGVPAGTRSNCALGVVGDTSCDADDHLALNNTALTVANFRQSTTYFTDDMESGGANWSASAPWSLTTESAHSGTHAWSDSPGGPYGPNVTASLSSSLINLSTASSPQLRFWQRRDFASGDSGKVWISTDQTTFTQLQMYDGTNLTWTESIIDLSAYVGFSTVQILFQVVSNASGSGDGWYIDDVVVRKALPPGAFTKSSPANGAVNRPTSLTLGWTSSSDATGYEYCYDTTNNNACSVWTPVGNTLSAALSGLSAATPYYWHVRATNATGIPTYADGSATAFWSFTTAPPKVDLNGDANGDVFLYKPQSGGWAFQNSTAGGGFTGTNGAWSPGWSVTPATFNGDLLTDVFLFSPTSGQWFKMLNNGAGGFTVQASGFWWNGWQRHVVDVDGDGLSDVFLWDPVVGTWFKCVSTGGGFTCTQGVWSPGFELYPVRFNSDTLQDFFLFNRSSGLWFWALGAAGGGFTYPQSGFWSTEWQLSPGDYSGDGLTDLLLLRPTTGFWFVATTGAAGFTFTSGFFSLGWTLYPMDLDANGRTDLFLHNPATGQWFEMLSNGAGAFTNAGNGFWSLGWMLHPTDLNGDGRGDLLLYNPTTGHWFQARNLTLGTFSYSSGIWDAGLTIVTGPPR